MNGSSRSHGTKEQEEDAVRCLGITDRLLQVITEAKTGPRYHDNDAQNIYHVMKPSLFHRDL